MTTIRALASADLPALHRGFLVAFSDYLVPMKLSREGLEGLLVSRGHDPRLSRIAVEEGEVVGFWLTGVEEGPHGRESYDIATGVAPSARRRGLAAALWHDLEPALRAAGCRRCTLEVIRGNGRAIALYRSLGFATVRALDCFRFPESLCGSTGPPPGVELAPERGLPPGAETWWDWRPSWPGRSATVARAGEDAAVVVARAAGEPVGYAAVVRSAANLAQIAVAPQHRRRGVGRSLLAAAAGTLPEGVALRMLNVPPDAAPTLELLREAGGEMTVGQWEMVRELA